MEFLMLTYFLLCLAAVSQCLPIAIEKSKPSSIWKTPRMVWDQLVEEEDRRLGHRRETRCKIVPVGVKQFDQRESTVRQCSLFVLSNRQVRKPMRA